MGVSRKFTSLLMTLLGVSLLTTLIFLGSRNDGLVDNIDSMEFDEQAILERAYEDVRNAEELPPIDEELIIKIFDEDNKLIKSMTMIEGDEIVDENFRKLINQSTLLAEYRTSKIYRLDK